jgi:osmoprotectant transport system ATP-binding protein
MPDIIKLLGVRKKYPNSAQYAVDGVSADIPDGGFVTIVGSSGSGKTTLLKLVNKLQSLSDGDIYFNGESIADLQAEAYRKKIGYVIQQIGLFPHMTVEQNISVVPNSLKWDKKRIADRVEYLLGLVQLEPRVYKKRYPSQLSGGQQQRVGLARALAAEPNVLLMDEPFGAIDRVTRQSLQKEIKEIHKRLRKTIVFVTHDLHEAFTLGEKVMIMHDGQIQQFDTPYNILFRPANDYVTRLISTESTFEKLQALTAGSIAKQRSGTPPSAIRVRADAPLSSVLGAFVESGARIALVENDARDVVGEIAWNDFLSIEDFREEIEYYV